MNLVDLLTEKVSCVILAVQFTQIILLLGLKWTKN